MYFFVSLAAVIRTIAKLNTLMFLHAKQANTPRKKNAMGHVKNSVNEHLGGETTAFAAVSLTIYF